MSDSSHFAFAWDDYRRRRRWFFGVWLGGIPVFVVLSMSLIALLHSDLPFYFVGGAYMLAFVIASLRLSFFRCPRCGHPFFTTWWRGNPLAQKCLHCRLPKWSESDLHENQVV
jgi:hypothetical protein